MSSELKLMEDITFSDRLNQTEVSKLKLFILEHWLAKMLLNNSALSFRNEPILIKPWRDARNIFITMK